MYRGLEVMVNTNEPKPGGGWYFTGAEIVKRDAHISAALRIRSWPFQNRHCVLQRSSKYIPLPVPQLSPVARRLTDASYIKERVLSHL